MQKIPNAAYTAEFKEQAVKRVKDGKPVGAVAKEMGLVKQTLRNWVKVSDARQAGWRWHPEGDAGRDGAVAPAR